MSITYRLTLSGDEGKKLVFSVPCEHAEQLKELWDRGCQDLVKTVLMSEYGDNMECIS